MNADKISMSTFRWGVGLTATILIFLTTSLWAASDAANERESQLRVLTARVDTLETSVDRVSILAASINANVSEMKASQASFQATLKTQIGFLREGLEDLKNRRGRGPSSR